MEAIGTEFQAPRELFDETWAQVMKELHAESERACAIVGGAFLDDLLGELLEVYLVENNDVSSDLLSSENINAPLGSFGARILAAYATGPLPKANWAALRKVKKIRNRFAHDLSLSFNESGISKLCAELAPLTKDPLGRERTPRDVFEATIAFLAGGLREHLYLTKKFELKGTFGAVVRLASGQGSKKSAGQHRAGAVAAAVDGIMVVEPRGSARDVDMARLRNSRNHSEDSAASFGRSR